MGLLQLMLGRMRATAVCWKTASINEQQEQVNTPVNTLKRSFEACSRCQLGKALRKAELLDSAGKGYKSQQVS